MPANTFSTGRDCQLVVIAPKGSGGQGGRVDLTHVTSFESQQMTHPIRIDRLDGVHLAAELPKGWEGHFELDRGNSAAAAPCEKPEKTTELTTVLFNLIRVLLELSSIHFRRAVISMGVGHDRRV